MNPILFLGALLGLMSVIMGAYTDHVVGVNITSTALGVLATALHYQSLYSILIAAIGLALYAPLSPRLTRYLTMCAWVFIIGIILFSFSIYASVLTNASGAVRLTPVGGITLILGWLLLAGTGLMKVRRERLI
ncbi:MAG: hypothetical protein A3F10_00030 [Coxiella sp. RIFCSPHIGHO2_12_FULL_42_15]|nr:MAG: hypothetical protein A3F10_00030 [Coxiella sp. RIFCSPHIGHO2_12_FULL_42_15]